MKKNEQKPVELADPQGDLTELKSRTPGETLNETMDLVRQRFSEAMDEAMDEVNVTFPSWTT